MALVTSASDAMIFQMASQISKEHPQIDIPTAISIAAKLLPAASQMGGRSATAVPKKPKKPRAKNAYMFYLAQNRTAFKEELTAAAKDKDPDAKLRVTEVTKLAGARWKQLSMAEKLPYEQMAAEAKLKLQNATASTTDNTNDGGTAAAAAPDTMVVETPAIAPAATSGADATTSAVSATAAPVATSSSTNDVDSLSSDNDEDGDDPNATSVSAQPPVPPS
jgi:hypothetical protein